MVSSCCKFMCSLFIMDKKIIAENINGRITYRLVLTQKKLDRCSHTSIDDLMCHHEHVDEFPSDGRVIINSNKIDIGTTPIKITIPIVVHVICRVAVNNPDNTINIIKNILIPRLNADFNYNASKSADYTSFINQVMPQSSRKNFYLSQTSALSPWNVTFEFVFDKLNFKPVTSNPLTIKGDVVSNDPIYRASPAESPDTKLNIWIAEGSSILGIARFPFNDRAGQNPTLQPQFAYRHGVIVNSSVFYNPSPPYHLFKTFSHEIGHYFGLLHTFDNTSSKTAEFINGGAIVDYPGNDPNEFTGDLIPETPIQSSPTIGNITSSSPVLLATPFFFNIMDYTNDAFLLCFTKTQILRMVYFIKKYHPTMIIDS